MAPVLLDQRRLSCISAAVLCALVLAFYAGYRVAQSQRDAISPILSTERLPLDLPAPEPSASADNAPVLPVVTAAGANIDVDAPNGQRGAAPAVATTTEPSDSSATTPLLSPSVLLASDASADTARYTIQVGIYGSFDNAERQLAVLRDQNLSGYSRAYQTPKNETRYQVRFGYYATWSKAKAALQAWQMQPASGRAILVRLRR